MSVAPELGGEPRPPARPTSGYMLRKLQELSYRNRRFRDGESDGFGFSLYEDDSDAHYCEEDEEEALDIEEAGIELGVEYSFTVERNYDDLGTPITTYIHTVSTKLYGAELPDNIAENAFGLMGQEAVEEAGRITMTRTVEFTISTGNRSVHTCESITYIDEDEDVVSYACTCPHPTNGESVEQSSNDDDLATFDFSDGERSRWAEAPERESLAENTPEQALAKWVTAANIERFEPDIREFEYDENLVLAAGVLERMQTLLDELAGKGEG